MGCLFKLITAPVRFVLWLTGLIIEAVGRLLALVIGLTVCVLGVLLSLTGLGAVIGVPMVILGGGLMMRCIF